MRKAFTLVELMIVVAIIGILAAIAIPNFMDMQYRAKRAEVPINVDGIKTAEMGYEAAFDEFIAVTAPHPSSTVNKTTQTWTLGASDFDTLGWAPDGAVRGNYKVATGAGGSGATGDFTVTGTCDVDGDTTIANYTATKTINTSFNNLNDTF